MQIHGLQPGPNLMKSSPDLFYLIVSILLVSSVFLVVFGLTGVKLFAKIVEVPKSILMPMIIILSVVGSFALRKSLFDIFWMLGFGILGYFMKRYDYPVAPCVLGIILCNLLENNYRRGITLQKSLLRLVGSIFTEPVALVLFAVIVIMFVTQTKAYKNWKARREAAKG